MENAQYPVVSPKGLSQIHAVNRDYARRGAIISLVLWGSINIGGWLFFGKGFRQTLGGLSEPSIGIYFLMYGSFILGVVLLAFAFIGSKRTMMTAVMLNGLSLIFIGLWNMSHDFIAIGALKAYGYTIEVSKFWVFLGLMQIGWGINQFSHGLKLKNLPFVEVSPSEMSVLQAQLSSFVRASEKETKEIVKATISEKGGLFNMMPRITGFTGRLLDGEAIFISRGLDDSFVIKREDAKKATFSKSGMMTVEVSGVRKALTLNAASLSRVKEWCEGGGAVEEKTSKASDPAAEQKKNRVLSCAHCGATYNTVDFRADASVWFCSACRQPLSREGA